MTRFSGLLCSVNNKQYKVLIDFKKIIKCEAKQTLYFSKNHPLVGDKVICEKDDYGTVSIIDIKPRFNQLLRPKIVNVDQVIIMITVIKPKLDSYFLMKYLAHILFLKIPILICFNKIDLLKKRDASLRNMQLDLHKLGFKTITISNFKAKFWNLWKLKKYLKNKLTVLAGNSGVGKSTTINSLFGLNIKTSQLSSYLKKGVQTTTALEIYFMNKILIADSPGFLSFYNQLSISDLSAVFPLFWKNKDLCFFKNCQHNYEKNCKIKSMVKDKQIPNWFYQDYLQMIKKLK